MDLASQIALRSARASSIWLISCRSCWSSDMKLSLEVDDEPVEPCVDGRDPLAQIPGFGWHDAPGHMFGVVGCAELGEPLYGADQVCCLREPFWRGRHLPHLPPHLGKARHGRWLVALDGALELFG